eukprot:CAMPEP_0198285160 /NCGR_PEP_ID=MMETSP1449-20131203/4470_1 /TAXON_ID=420275 /ORGANISM="Attheya septentrionalis, Strain CCMP2084" /LENGTH=764 /DNA_ID=CAMNT_0043982447 /DNA_START=115 /DNA_END=2409 /DNA_ORIENTATION=+
MTSTTTKTSPSISTQSQSNCTLLGGLSNGDVHDCASNSHHDHPVDEIFDLSMHGEADSTANIVSPSYKSSHFPMNRLVCEPNMSGDLKEDTRANEEVQTTDGISVNAGNTFFRRHKKRRSIVRDDPLFPPLGSPIDSPGEKKVAYTPPLGAPPNCLDISGDQPIPSAQNEDSRQTDFMGNVDATKTNDQLEADNDARGIPPIGDMPCIDLKIMDQQHTGPPSTLGSEAAAHAGLGSAVSQYLLQQLSQQSNQGSISKHQSENMPSSVISCTSSIASNTSGISNQMPSNSIPYHATNRQKNQSRVQPVVYSAIGSLEHYNAASLGSFNARLALGPTTGRDFSRMGAGASNTLLAPPPPHKIGHDAASEDARQYRPSTNTQPSALSTLTPQVAPEENEKRSKIKVRSQRSSQNRNSNRQGVKQSGEPKGKQAENGGILKHASSRSLLNSNDTISKPHATKNRADGKRVRIKQQKSARRPVEMFRPSCDAYTPRMGKKVIKYKPAETRIQVENMSTTMGTIQRPNFRDALRRVAMIMQNHICKIEERFENVQGDSGLFMSSMKEEFSEENFAMPRYRCTTVRIPMARPGVIYGLRKIHVDYQIPSAKEIYDFAHQLFHSVQLSSECSIVCLIYVERLMEVAKVPLLACTWKPIFMCGLLLASKVWQDLSSWNIEFASVYPQFSLNAINRLELQFLRKVKWDLYISSSLYAKYYFALRSLLEKPDFRQKYNSMVVGVGIIAASEAKKIQERTEALKEDVLLQQLSRSM